MVLSARGKQDSWGKCATSVECKTDISVMLMVKRSPDFFVISGDHVGGWLVQWLDLSSDGFPRVGWWLEWISNGWIWFEMVAFTSR